MTNHFQTLELEPRPWLDETLLKDAYFKKTATEHPDKKPAVSGSTSSKNEPTMTAINEAHQILSSHKTRLAHLLELTTGSRPREITTIDDEEAEQFMSFNTIMRRVDNHLQAKEAAGTAMERALLQSEGLEQVDSLQTFQLQLNQQIGGIETQIQELDEHWLAQRQQQKEPPLMASLEHLYRRISHLTKWHAQIQDRLSKLAT